MTRVAALSTVTRLVEHVFEPIEPTGQDPFYVERDYVREFFTQATEFQSDLVDDENYAVLLAVFGGNLFYKSGSRASRRQYDTWTEAGSFPHVADFRAIPHNATLHQLGILVNTVGGIGNAIIRDPAKFNALYNASPRFRHLLGIVEHCAQLSNHHTLKAYVDFLNPDFWLACSAASGATPSSEIMRKVADQLESTETFIKVGTVYRKIIRDFSVLRQNMVGSHSTEMEKLGSTEEGLTVEAMLAILHAIRLALIGEIFRVADRIPEFASINGMNRSGVVSRIFHLDVPGAVRDLETIFPKGSDESFYDDKIFNEVATYIVDESQSFESEHATIFRPMMRLYDLNCRVSAAVTHLIGAFG